MAITPIRDQSTGMIRKTGQMNQSASSFLIFHYIQRTSWQIFPGKDTTLPGCGITTAKDILRQLQIKNRNWILSIHIL